MDTTSCAVCAAKLTDPEDLTNEFTCDDEKPEFCLCCDCLDKVLNGECVELVDGRYAYLIRVKKHN